MKKKKESYLCDKQNLPDSSEATKDEIGELT